jgi:hypothetical protein
VARRVPPRGRPAEPGDHRSSPDGAQPPGVQQAVARFCDAIFQRGILQRELGVQPLEPSVRVFEVLQPLHVGCFPAAVCGFPLIVGSRANAVVPPDFVDRATGIGFFQDANDLGSVNFDCRMGTSWLRGAILPERSPFELSQSAGSLQLS